MTQADLARASGLSTGGVANLINQTRRPSEKSLIAIARALKLPPEEVYRAAGLLPKKSYKDAIIDRITYLLEQLPPEMQERYADMMEWDVEQQERKKREGQKREA